MKYREYIDCLEQKGILTQEMLEELIGNYTEDDWKYARNKARKIATRRFGNKIYIRGLIEFTNYCKNNCFYCGLRKGNGKVERYRMTEKDILDCCIRGYQLGFRTFVLQGGEDPFFTEDKMEQIIWKIKKKYPDCAITLSIGEKSFATYERLFKAGADRYLLRHETADEEHYTQLHPTELLLKNRKECLKNLKKIGYQTGCGFMVGTPGQGAKQLAEDLRFIYELCPEMVGIGPFIPHSDTPFAKEKSGSLRETLFCISLLRIMKKDLLLPATTALATIHPKGREEGILSGANVVMPNLSPVEVRGKYSLYDNKACTGEEAAECRTCLERRLNSINYKIAIARGDYQEE